MPCPRSLCGAGLSEVAQSVRLPVRRVHLAVRRWSQRPYIDRMALDFKQSSLRHISGPGWLAGPSLSGTFTLHHCAGLSRRLPERPR